MFPSSLTDTGVTDNEDVEAVEQGDVVGDECLLTMLWCYQGVLDHLQPLQ